jgi:hypothetical protein
VLVVWTDDQCLQRLVHPELHKKNGNGLALNDLSGHEHGEHGVAAVGQGWSREHAQGRKDRHDVSLVQPREQVSLFACCPNSGWPPTEGRRKWGARV